MLEERRRAGRTPIPLSFQFKEDVFPSQPTSLCVHRSLFGWWNALTEGLGSFLKAFIVF